MSSFSTETEQEIKRYLINICVIMRNYGVGKKKRFNSNDYSHMEYEILNDDAGNTPGFRVFRYDIMELFTRKNMSSLKRIKYFLNNMVNYMDKNECELSFISDYSNNPGKVCFTKLLAFYNN
jgi:hypothetical protein